MKLESVLFCGINQSFLTFGSNQIKKKLNSIFMTEKRVEKFRRVARHRQGNLTIILENVHDPHNIGAVLRSCDSVGVKEIFVLYTEPELQFDRLYLGKNTAAGALKWVDVHFYRDPEACFKHVKSKYKKIFSTHLAEDSVEIYDLNLADSVALLFGNERDGVSATSQKYADGNFIIPQVGMVQSLNISVACAVTLYEAYRQRREKGMYGENPSLSEIAQVELFDAYVERHKRSGASRKIRAIGDE